jgi:23S rRNA pseudouridine2605 synthase
MGVCGQGVCYEACMDQSNQDQPKQDNPGERIAKRIARAGICSRRDAERMIEAGRVRVNGKTISSPALNVSDADDILVDSKVLPQAARTRVWRYHKPAGLVTSHKDTRDRATVFEKLPANLPRVISVGRLDINTEGLLLLTNDGELARALELPATGWVRRYRVRAFGKITQEMLDTLKKGIEIDGIKYGPIEAVLDKTQRDNSWMTLGLREGKNREVKRVLEHLGLKVNRLIRLSFGPFQLGDLNGGEVSEVPPKVLRDQIGSLAGDLKPCRPTASQAQRPETKSRPARTSAKSTKKRPHARRRRNS